MREVLVAGAGKIGSLVATLLVESGDYLVYVADIEHKSSGSKEEIPASQNLKKIHLDITHTESFTKFIQKSKLEAVISCLPYFVNPALAALAKNFDLHYFDTTEDTEVSAAIKKLAFGSIHAFIPQCGLAPGFISILANSLAKSFDQIESILMRVGNLPVHPHSALKYAINWSVDGLINQYGNLCYGISNGKPQLLQSLEGLETIEIDGALYEAFNTSGGVGTLVESYDGKVAHLNYKTLRYPGHCQLIHFLMNELKLNNDRQTLKRILENALPKTHEDVVIIYAAVKGMQNGQLIEDTAVKKIYPQEIAGKLWSAIQVTTATSVCAIVDIVLNKPQKYQGFVLQEQFELSDFLANRFGQYYVSKQ